MQTAEENPSSPCSPFLNIHLFPQSSRLWIWIILGIGKHHVLATHKRSRWKAGADAYPGPPGPWPGVRPKFFSFCSSFYFWTWINCWRMTWINCWRRINILLRDDTFCMLFIFLFIFSCIFWTVSLWTSILKTRPGVRLNADSATASYVFGPLIFLSYSCMFVPACLIKKTI